MHTSPVLTVPDVATQLDCAVDTVRELARVGDLPGIKVGRDWVFPAAAFYAALNRLAEAQAAQRRDPPKPSAQLRALPAGNRRRRTTPAPALPVMGA